ncbi:uncharacterized protein LOC135847545 [Planococcus citri]|uniref:uncharacterized protein LOC135847545 n=1 Tax=Planococcus citri TaxID=170843 RepID=UPI0031F737B1
MKFLHFSLFFYSTLWFINCALAQVNPIKNPLLYNLKTLKLEEPNRYTDSKKDTCSFCITACSAVTKRQRLINVHASITGNAIFLRGYYEDAFPGYKKIDPCDESLTPVMVWDSSTNLYKTGYELFYSEGGAVKLKCDKYKDFSKPKITDDEAETSPARNPVLAIKTEDEEGNTKFETPETDAKLVFYWISVLSIRVSEQQRQINFEKDHINNLDHAEKTMNLCKDYNLGDEAQNVPSEKWQRHQAKEAKPLQFSDLEETQIMPMRYFHTFSARLSTCTFLNVAYVWKGVENEQLKKVDVFLRCMHQVYSPRINIIFGTEGTSKEVTAQSLKQINSPDNKILRKFPIPVPEIIYRIVEYLGTDGRTYNVVIVIHNVLGSVTDEDRICPLEFEVKGWDYVKVQPEKVHEGYNEPSGLTYACGITEKVIKKLKADYEKTASMADLLLTEGDPERILKCVDGHKHHA